MEEVVYTGGYCTGEGTTQARAGFGVYFGEDDVRNVSSSIGGVQTLQRAEISAIIRALEITAELEAKTQAKKPVSQEPGTRKSVPQEGSTSDAASGQVTIVTNSMDVYNACASWLAVWNMTDWEGDIQDKDLYQKLTRLLKNRSVTLKLDKSKGSQSVTNLAREGALLFKDSRSVEQRIQDEIRFHEERLVESQRELTKLRRLLGQ